MTGSASAWKEVGRRDKAVRGGVFVPANQGGRQEDRVAVGPKRMIWEGAAPRMSLWRSV